MYVTIPLRTHNPLLLPYSYPDPGAPGRDADAHGVGREDRNRHRVDTHGTTPP